MTRRYRSCRWRRRASTGQKAAAAVAAALALGAAVPAAHHGRNGPVPTSEAAWARDVLRAGGWPRTRAGVSSLETWASRESPWSATPPDGALYTHNPLNVTYGPGATSSVPGTPGVSILPDWGTGIADTAGRIADGTYPGLAAALASGTGLCGFRQDFATWSGGGYSSIC